MLSDTWAGVVIRGTRRLERQEATVEEQLALLHEKRGQLMAKKMGLEKNAAFVPRYEGVSSVTIG